jgi:hypothetical protein
MFCRLRQWTLISRLLGMGQVREIYSQLSFHILDFFTLAPTCTQKTGQQNNEQ